nr:hypothetical protein [Thaumasiovibrio occultus]
MIIPAAINFAAINPGTIDLVAINLAAENPAALPATTLLFFILIPS